MDGKEVYILHYCGWHNAMAGCRDEHDGVSRVFAVKMLETHDGTLHYLGGESRNCPVCRRAASPMNEEDKNRMFKKV